MNHTIRRLTRQDVEAYRAIRLEALTNHPEAFATAAEDFARRSPAELESLLEQVVVLAATAPDDRLVGIMAYDRGAGREAHRGWLIQVYVRPEMRGTGCAGALLDAIVEQAKTEVLQLHLSVESRNEPAIRLYKKAGFVLYGSDPRYQFVNGRYVDEHLMVRFFDKAPGDSK